MAEALSSYFSHHQITWITRLLYPAVPCPPGPPGFLFPNHTTQCYWGSETGRLKTGMEKTSLVQILNRNRDGDDAKAVATRQENTSLWLRAQLTQKMDVKGARRAVMRALQSYGRTYLCELHPPRTRASKSSAYHTRGVSSLWLMSSLMKQQQRRRM